MKEGVHPDYHEIIVVETNGNEYVTRSCFGKKGDKLRLDVDRHSHAAWTGKKQTVLVGGQMSKFEGRYGKLGQQHQAE